MPRQPRRQSPPPPLPPSERVSRRPPARVCCESLALLRSSSTSSFLPSFLPSRPPHKLENLAQVSLLPFLPFLSSFPLPSHFLPFLVVPLHLTSLTSLTSLSLPLTHLLPGHPTPHRLPPPTSPHPPRSPIQPGCTPPPLLSLSVSVSPSLLSRTSPPLHPTHLPHKMAPPKTHSPPTVLPVSGKPTVSPPSSSTPTLTNNTGSSSSSSSSSSNTDTASSRIQQITSHLAQKLPSTLRYVMSTQEFKQAPHKVRPMPCFFLYDSLEAQCGDPLVGGGASLTEIGPALRGSRRVSISVWGSPNDQSPGRASESCQEGLARSTAVARGTAGKMDRFVFFQPPLTRPILCARTLLL